MVKETAGQEFLMTTIIYFEHYIILASSDPAYYYFEVLFTLVITSREMDERRRPQACSRPCALEETKSEKTR